MTKLEQKLKKLGYEYYRPQFENFIYTKTFFFRTWFVIIDNSKSSLQHTIFCGYSKPSLNLIAYLRYKKDLKELELCQD